MYKPIEDCALLLHFEDKIKKSNNKETIEISGKGVITNAISAFIMNKLDLIGIDNHLIKKINMRRQLVQMVDVFPIQVNICSVACGRYVKEFGIEEGFVFESPITEFRVKNKDLGYPVINESQIKQFGWLATYEIKEIKQQATRVHDFLTGLFTGIGIRLVDCNLEFGVVFDGENYMIMLADEISPDTCKLWNMSNNEKLSYELVDTDPEQIIPAYQNILSRLNNSVF